MSKLKRFISNFIKLFILKFSKRYLDLFEKLLQDCDTVLDLGCGQNSSLGMIKKKKKYTLGVDIFENYIEISKNKKIHDDYLLLDILEIDKKVNPKSFDCVILIDVLEHLSKIDGIWIIKKMERIATKKIVIFTPNGFIPQEQYCENIYQTHKSGWCVKDFIKMGFNIYGIHGIKWLRKEFGIIKYRPINFWSLISRFTDLFVKKCPQFAYQLLCYKNFNIK